eukprot:TRINITY_DN5566_c0_g1_i2.p1 TRINITY_DN5566_c0_g1~~TRINITY_DN5566_c0_g1_i2.p1  ORF type:complete len:177 (-),score=26.44 TRINITY_DN5566_c0_g1_i2:59-589(-)
MAKGMNEFKVVVLGSCSVGKSAATVLFACGVFVEDYDPTIEESYRTTAEIDGTKFLLEIYDTAGTQKFTFVRDMYMKSANGFLLLYSITSRMSFTELQELRERIELVRGEKDFPCVVVGNKCDLVMERDVDREEGDSFAKQFENCEFFEASAKKNINISETFHKLISLMYVPRTLR